MQGHTWKTQKGYVPYLAAPLQHPRIYCCTLLVFVCIYMRCNFQTSETEGAEFKCLYVYSLQHPATLTYFLNRSTISVHRTPKTSRDFLRGTEIMMVYHTTIREDLTAVVLVMRASSPPLLPFSPADSPVLSCCYCFHRCRISQAAEALVATGAEDSTVRLWDLRDGATARTPAGSGTTSSPRVAMCLCRCFGGEAVSSVVFGADGAHHLYCSAGGKV